METLSAEESTYISVDTAQWPALELEILTLPDSCHSNNSSSNKESREMDFLYRLKASAQECIVDYPALRKKLITPIFSMAQPRWVDDPNFDLAYHIGFGKSENLTASKKFGDNLYIELMQKHTTLLDRGSPLWRIFIYALPAGRSQHHEGDATHPPHIQPARYLIVCACHLALRQRLQTSLSSIFFKPSPQRKSKATQKRSEEAWCPDGLPSRNDLLEAARSDVSKLPNKFRQAIENLLAANTTHENSNQSIFNRHSSFKEKLDLLKQSQQRWVAPICSFNGSNLVKPKWSLNHWSADIESMQHVLKSMRNVNITDGVLTLLADACYSYLGYEGISRELTALIRHCKNGQAPTLSRISLPNPYQQGRDLRQSVCTLHTHLHQTKEMQHLQNLSAIFPQKITKPIAESVQWLQNFQKRNLLWNLCIAEQEPQQHSTAANLYRWALPLFPGCNVQLMFRVEKNTLFVEILADEKYIDFKKFTDALNRGLRGWKRASQRIERENTESKKAVRLPKNKIDKQQAS